MPGSLTIRASVPTTAPVDLGGTVSASEVYFGGPSVLVADVMGNADRQVLLHRWSSAFSKWIPLPDGAVSIVADAPKTTVWRTHGISEAYYCLVADGAITGTWQPIPGLAGTP